MSRPDSIRALAIYRTFTKQTEAVVQFLGVARQFQSATRLEIPKLKHASTDLARLLEDDLNDPDFDLRRREYLAQKEAKKGGRPATSAGGVKASNSVVPQLDSRPISQPAKKPEQQKPPPTDLIDFFDSIEQNQQPMGQQASMQTGMQYQQTGFQQMPQQGIYLQQTGFPQQQQPQATGYHQPYSGPLPTQDPSNPFAQQLQATPTGAGFGGYTPQPQSYGYQAHLTPIPQNGATAFPAQQQQLMQNQQPSTPTNPFRQSMMLNSGTGAQAPATPLTRQNTNPFSRRLSMANSQFSSGSPGQFSAPQPATPQPVPAQPLQIQRTGTNPFARSASVPPPQQQQQQSLQPPAAPLQPNPTGSTNPFRQSAFINQQTGQGWQASGQHGTMGGLEQLDTVPIFPRPGVT